MSQISDLGLSSTDFDKPYNPYNSYKLRPKDLNLYGPENKKINIERLLYENKDSNIN
jgi:hypothetical protein